VGDGRVAIDAVQQDADALLVGGAVQSPVDVEIGREERLAR
jgi:hypothetical protein